MIFLASSLALASPALELPASAQRAALTIRLVHPGAQAPPGDKLEIYDADDKLLQSISLVVPGEPPGTFEPGALQSVDANFDGHPDLQLLVGMGMVNASYRFWLWDPGQGRFALNEELSALTSPRFDAAQEQIHWHERHTACAWSEGTKAWKGGSLVDVRSASHACEEP